MGRATVSADGAFLITDLGSGLTKAGWGGICRYDPPKCALTEQPSISKLEIKVIGNGDSNSGGRTGEMWIGQNEPLAFVSDDVARSCRRDYTWNFGDGGTSKARNPFYSFSRSGLFNVTLKLSCSGDECVNETQQATSRIVNVCEGSNVNQVTPEFIEVAPVRTKAFAIGGGGDKLGGAGPEKITVTDIGASCENGDWFPMVKGIRGEFSRYLRRDRPNTAAITSAKEADGLWFCAQVQDLSHLPKSAKYSGPDWVHWPAAEAHENVHMVGFKSRFNRDFVETYNAYLKANLRLPISQFSKDAAIAHFRQSALLGDTGAEAEFAKFNTFNGGPAEDGIPLTCFAYMAERPIVKPIVDGICLRAKQAGWDNGSCSECGGK